jgi:hypothetical protein
VVINLCHEPTELSLGNFAILKAFSDEITTDKWKMNLRILDINDN